VDEYRRTGTSNGFWQSAIGDALAKRYPTFWYEEMVIALFTFFLSFFFFK
jgi:hypothetical protein